MAPIDQRQHLHGGGTTAVDERIERSANRATGEEHVVDHDHDGAVDARRRPTVHVVEGWMGRGRTRTIVAMCARVEGGNRWGGVAEADELMRHGPRERDAAGGNADQHDALQRGMALGDLVGETHDDALHRPRIEQLRAVVEWFGKTGHGETLMRAASRAAPS